MMEKSTKAVYKSIQKIYGVRKKDESESCEDLCLSGRGECLCLDISQMSLLEILGAERLEISIQDGKFKRKNFDEADRLELCCPKALITELIDCYNSGSFQFKATDLEMLKFFFGESALDNLIKILPLVESVNCNSALEERDFVLPMCLYFPEVPSNFDKILSVFIINIVEFSLVNDGERAERLKNILDRLLNGFSESENSEVMESRDIYLSKINDFIEHFSSVDLFVDFAIKLRLLYHDIYNMEEFSVDFSKTPSIIFKVLFVGKLLREFFQMDLPIPDIFEEPARAPGWYKETENLFEKLKNPGSVSGEEKEVLEKIMEIFERKTEECDEDVDKLRQLIKALK